MCGAMTVSTLHLAQECPLKSRLTSALLLASAVALLVSGAIVARAAHSQDPRQVATAISISH